MKNVLIVLCSLLFLACQPQESEIKILQFNIWQEGTVVPGGYEAIVDEIVRLDPDFVTFSEVRNYNKTRFCDRIVNSLADRGKKYYSFYSYDSGLLSKYPVKDSLTVFPEKDDHGSIYKLVTSIGNQEISVYTAHLDYRNCAIYLPRGYDGSTWEKLPSPVTAMDSILRNNIASQRDDAIAAFISDARQDIAKGRIVFMGGDLNEASHLDWTAATKDLYDHQGLVIPWTCTKMLEDAGFKDSYREFYPDPVTHPGFTFPADCEGVDISKLAWAPEADDRDRIDFIFYYPNNRLSLSHSVIIGPKGSVCHNERIQEVSQDIFIAPAGIWPTDHKAVMSTFKMKP